MWIPWTRCGSDGVERSRPITIYRLYTLVVTSATLVVTGALLVVTRFATRNKCLTTSNNKNIDYILYIYIYMSDGQNYWLTYLVTA